MNEPDPFDEIAKKFATLSPDKFKQRMNEMLESHPNEESKKFWDEYSSLREKPGEYDKKIKLLNSILEINTENFLANFEKGRLLGESGNHQEALTCFEKVTELKPEHVLGWTNRGYALNLLGKNEESLQYFDRAIELDKNNFLPYEYKGMALGNLDRYEEAIECFTETTRLDPDNILSWFKKGFAYFRIAKPTMGDEDKKNYEKALECFEKATSLLNTMEVGVGLITYVVEEKPYLAKTKILYHKGLTFLILKQPKEALECFEEILHVDPHSSGKDPKIWYAKSQALQELEMEQKSNKCFEYALELGFKPGKDFLYKENPEDLTSEEEREFQPSEEEREEEEFKKEKS